MTPGCRVALIPGVLALLPEHASLIDPVAELRTAVLESVSWLAEDGRDVEIVASAQGRRVAEAMLQIATGQTSRLASGPVDTRAVLVVGNGTACRTEKAPGFLDERAEAYDRALRHALTAEPALLGGLDTALGEELWADVAQLPALAELVAGARARVRYDKVPYGVQYWVICWEPGR